MSANSALVFILFWVPFGASGQDVSPLSFLMEKRYIGVREIPYVNDKWLGFFRDGDSYGTRWTTINVDVVEVDEPCRSYTEVSTNAANTPAFLIHGLNDATEGDIDVVLDFSSRGGNERFLYPGQSQNLSYLDNVYAIVAVGTAHEVEFDNGVRIADYGFLIRRRQGNENNYVSQIVGNVEQVSPDRPPTLQWAGDIDRDGELDFLFDLAWHYNVRSFTLYLSSLKTNEPLLKKTAELLITGC